MRQREMVARHAEQVLWIGKALAADRIFLISQAARAAAETADDDFEMDSEAIHMGLLPVS